MMKQISVSNGIFYLIFFCSTAAGYFAISDLQISILLADRNADWAILMEKFGELPGLLVLFAGINLYLAYTLSFKKVFEGTKTIILFLGALFVSCYIFIVVFYGIEGSYNLLIGNSVLIIASITAFNIAIQFFLNKKKFLMSVIQFSKITVLLGFTYLSLIQPIKMLWGRIRFRDLDNIYSNFSDWYIINGINGNESFPSGHSAMGWMLLPLLILFGKSKVKKRILFIIILIWAPAVGLSRVIAGAHYASDVLVGALIVILVYIITISKLSKR